MPLSPPSIHKALLAVPALDMPPAPSFLLLASHCPGRAALDPEITALPAQVPAQAPLKTHVFLLITDLVIRMEVERSDPVSTGFSAMQSLQPPHLASTGGEQKKGLPWRGGC